MTDRIPLDHMTSDALDQLYERIATLEHVAAGNKRHVQLIVPDLERATATLAAVTDLIADHEGDEWAAHPATTQLRAILNGEPQASTDASRWLHITIRNPDESTANRAALSLVDWINAEFPGHHVTTDAREWAEPIVTVHAAPNLSPEAAEALDALVGVTKRQIAEDAAAVPDGTDTTEPAWTPPPPGDTREQLPDHLLDLIRGSIPDYTSTACVTAYTLAVAVHWSHPRRAELGQWAERMHARCRINQKFTGQLCICRCHATTKEN